MGTQCPPRSWPCQIEAFFIVGSFARRERLNRVCFECGHNFESGQDTP